MSDHPAPSWQELVEAEKAGVEAGWLLPCTHRGITELPCLRAAGHELPHAVPPPPESAQSPPSLQSSSPNGC